MENWTEIKINVPVERVDEAGSIASMTVPYGIYIEDYSNLEAEAMEIAKTEGMLISFSEEELDKIVEEVLAEFKDAMKDYDKTPEKVVRFYIGKVMQKSKGLANPQLAQNKILNKIGK